MNNWSGIGRLTKDANLKFTAGDGKAVCDFTIALDDGFGDKKKTYYIPVICWGKIAENTANYTQKGSLVGVTGKLTTRSYDAKDGTKKYVTEIVASEVKFLESKKGNNNPAPQNNSFGGGYEDDITPVNDGDMPF